MIAMGIALIAIAWPDFRAYVAARKGNSAATMLREGQLPTADGFRRMLSSREQAAYWSPKAAFDRDRGLGYIALSQDAPTQPERLQRMGDAEAAFKGAVGRLPTNPEGLSLLAYAGSELGRRDDAVRMLRLGCELAPYAPEYSIIRTWVAIAMWDRLDDHDRGCANRNFRAAMTRDPSRFVELVAGAGFYRSGSRGHDSRSPTAGRLR